MRKKVLILLTICIITLLNCIAYASNPSTEFLDGDGSYNSPYVIASKTHFKNAINYPDAHFILFTDLSFTEDEIVTFSEFSGVFDGNNKTLTFPDNVKSPSVFGKISGLVKNLTISGEFSDASFAGTLTYGGVISGCRNEGNTRDGGIVDNCAGRIEYSSNAGNVYGRIYVGGIAATCSGEIIECYNIGTIIGENTYNTSTNKGEIAYLGGICGRGDNIINCYNTGHINGMNSYISKSGGIAGYSTRIENCYNVGRVLGSTRGEILADSSVWIEIASESCKNCYYYKEDILEGYEPRGIVGTSYACSYEELCQSVTFDGYDFVEVWSINSDAYNMPTLINNLHIEKNEDIENFNGGIGTFYSPYEISTKQHLQNMEIYPCAYFEIISDTINVGSWTPIFDEISFYGVLDGKGNTLSNMRVDVTNKYDEKSTTEAAFMIECSGIIRNVNIENSSFKAKHYTNYGVHCNASAYAINFNGVLENCKTIGDGNVSASSVYDDWLGGSERWNISSVAGGLIASGSGKIINCENNFDVNSSRIAGGIAGSVSSINSYTPSQVYRCINKGNIESYCTVDTLVLITGGIVGSGGPIEGCVNYGNVENYAAGYEIENGLYAGGISGGGTVYSSYNMGTVKSETYTNETYVGGIVASGNATNCFNNGKVSNATTCTDYYEKPEFFIGGISGEGNVTNCYTFGQPSYFWNGIEKERHYGNYTGSGDYTNCYYLGYKTYNPNELNSEYCSESAYSNFDFNEKWAFDPLSNYKYAVPVATLTKPSSIEIEGSTDLLYDTPEGVWPEIEHNIILKDENGNEYRAVIKPWMLSNINISKIGTQASNVAYNNVFAPQKVYITVSQKRAERIEILQNPTKTIYLKDEETFDPTGGTIKVYYNNSTTENVDLSCADIVGFDNSDAGKLELTVSYLGMETLLSIEISEEVSLVVKNLPNKLTYVQTQDISFNGLVVETICNKGITREISFSDLTIEADTKTIGTTTVTIKYKTLSTSFEINVTAKEIASATFIEPSDVIFYKGDTIEFKTGYVKAVYVSDDNYTENIPITTDLIRGYDETIVGYQKITIYLNEQYSWELFINVKPVGPVEINHIVKENGDTFDVDIEINGRMSEDNYICYIGVYNTLGQMIDCASYSDSEKLINYVVLKEKQAKYLKLFAFKKNLCPCISPYIININ